VDLGGDASGRVTKLRIVRNRLGADAKGGLRAEPTGETEELPVGLVFRSVGYRGVALPDLPFDDRKGVVPNRHGRVLDLALRSPLPGLYVAGWIKRGPTGVIGTNKPDALETVEAMLEDRAAGRLLQPASPSAAAAETTVRAREPRCVTYADWTRLDRLEQERGKPAGRPRVKLTSVEDMLAALRGA
jgi:ferredoxin--NADP+ reductase